MKEPGEGRSALKCRAMISILSLVDNLDILLGSS